MREGGGSAPSCIFFWGGGSAETNFGLGALGLMNFMRPGLRLAHSLPTQLSQRTYQSLCVEQCVEHPLNHTGMRKLPSLGQYIGIGYA